MAIVRKELGNNPKILQEKFRSHFSDGLGGIRYDAFCVGWGEGFREAKHQLQAENKQAIKFLEEALPHIECKNHFQNGLITAIGTFLQALREKPK